MAIKSFNKVSGDTRGILLNWSAPGGGVYSWYWPAQYAGVAGDLDNAATSLAAGITAASASIEAADKQFKQAGDVARVGAEACSRYCGPGFRAVRQAAISERQTTAAARYSLRQPVEASATPNSTAVEAIQRAEIRQTLFREFGTDLGGAFEWVMQSQGLDVLQAIVPAIDRTIFVKDKQLSDLLAEEFAIRKTIKFTPNEPSDDFATPADPLKNKMDDSSIRLLAKAKVGRIKLREEAVDAASKLLVATINFTAQSSNLTDTEALNLLFGKSA
ncbi:hypothetical protein [Mesorhizobium sp.]|uniref:hypothetical protein n=1 Tax=Mesorhizobium sp. TaxID=1871066 RepID=UPI000FE88C36|nr:hypothetical protein [Mesorhizobium sp.]RWD31158.1 MAG: hypothetical protein EOS33_14650 [Mesorhizobium sp.]